MATRKIKVSTPRIETLRVKNFRALHDVELRKMTPLTVILGPNGSGKSTIFDVFSFLHDCFNIGLRKALDRRGRLKELRTRGSEGPVEIELQYRETQDSPLITYHLSIDETPKGPIVSSERMQWRRGTRVGSPFRFLDFQNGAGEVVSGEMPDEQDSRIAESLDSPDLLAVNTLGQFTKHPRVAALRKFITGWYLSYINADSSRVTPEAGPQERLNTSGDNLANVIQYLKEQHPERLQHILRVLSQRIPHLESVSADIMQDGRLLLQVKDAPFDRPILARFASDGTLKLLAYLTVLYDPTPPSFIGIEEPENHLHPKLLPELAEECRQSTQRSQILVSTHSPFLVNGVKPEELWTVKRNSMGHTQVNCAANDEKLMAMYREDEHLGALWLQGYLDDLIQPRPVRATPGTKPNNRAER